MIDAKPPIRWVGGKRKLAPVIVKYLPADLGLYVEPFLGGGAVFLELVRQRELSFDAVLSADRNHGLIGLWETLQTPQFRARLSFAEIPDHYLHRRLIWNSLGPDEQREAPALFLWLMQRCFNGLWRENAQGQMNTPEGDGYRPTDWANLLEVHKALARAKILRGSYTKVIANMDSMALPLGGSTFYLDPPYDTHNGRGFVTYSRGAFGREDQALLLEMVRYLSRCGARVLISNAATEWVKGAYKEAGLKVAEISARRSIGAGLGGAKTAPEVLARNYDDEGKVFAWLK